MSTASRTARTSCGVRWTLLKAICFLGRRTASRSTSALRSAQGHHGRAVASLARSAFAQSGDGGMPTQVAAHRHPQLPGAVAMDDAHLLPRFEKGPIQVDVELDESRFDALA